MGFVSAQKRVVREEAKLLSMMPLSTTSKANKTLLYSIQQEVSSSYLGRCCIVFKACLVKFSSKKHFQLLGSTALVLCGCCYTDH